jgi:hypothetical protein
MIFFPKFLRFLNIFSIRVRFPMRSLDFFNLPNTSSRTVTLGSTQSVTEISTRNLPGGKGQPARLTTSPPFVSRSLRECGSLDFSQTLYVCTARYKGSFAFNVGAFEFLWKRNFLDMFIGAYNFGNVGTEGSMGKIRLVNPDISYPNLHSLWRPNERLRKNSFRNKRRKRQTL